jgi:hypothetical protein
VDYVVESMLEQASGPAEVVRDAGLLRDQEIELQKVVSFSRSA